MATKIPWRQFHLHTILKKRQEIKEALIKFLEFHRFTFYLLSYSGPKHCYLALGLYDAGDINTENVLKRAKELGVKRISEGDPDLRGEDGMVVDDIKELSMRTATKIFNLKKFTPSQIYLFIHFLMNQLGYSYGEELDIYLSLAYNVRLGQRK